MTGETAVHPDVATELDGAAEQLVREALAKAKSKRQVPRATYRLQMHAGFTLRDARRIVPYLDRLGISHLYTSSLLTARKGSLHGYDVADHRQLNPELGTEEDLAALADDLRQRGMGLILDAVPNHMWVGEDNEWWMDVLENGPTSRFANYFDIAWRNHPRERLRDKVLLPILDEPYGRFIEAGRLKLFFEQGRFGISVDQTRLPVDPRTYPVLLEPALESLRTESEPDAPEILELQSILSAASHLPPRDDQDSDHYSQARGEGTVIKRRLAELTTQHPNVVAHIEQSLRQIEGDVEKPESFHSLVALLEGQPYRPSFWRVALDEINYRRFFDVNDLAALATERPEVFQAIHAKPFEWLQQGIVCGLRIDHIDGLLDPKEYLDRLQQHFLLGIARSIWDQERAPNAQVEWKEVEPIVLAKLENMTIPLESRLYVVVEKILGSRESLPAKWACEGTTGYEFLNELNALFVASDNEEKLTQLYERFTGQTQAFEQIAYERKRQILRSTMASELDVLVHQLDNLAQKEWWSRDFTRNGLRHALEEMIACFPVYRTYVSAEPGPSDQMMILLATHRARSRNTLLGREMFEFVRDTLLLRQTHNATISPDYTDCQRQFARKFQQLTSPVMAKGVEDTALYEFNRLLSLNEVGGDPVRFGSTPDRFHAFLQARKQSQPNGMSPLSTHDTKRGEDVRARINVISQIPDEWSERIRHWRTINLQFKVELDEDTVAPDRNEEYLIYQTLVGAWPRSSVIDDEFIDRIRKYLIKALHEAKVHSSWIMPDDRYDEAVCTFVASILKADEFIADMNSFQKSIRPYGQCNSLAQTIVRCLSPGVPDTFQGTETWNDRLVDPDNRGPVDYDALQARLGEIEAIYKMAPAERATVLRRSVMTDLGKMLVTARALGLRRKHAALFETGDYLPLSTEGPDHDQVFAYALIKDRDAIIVTVPRLPSRPIFNEEEYLLNLDAQLALPIELIHRGWEEAFTGEQIERDQVKLPLKRLFANLPCSVLVST